MKLGTKIKELRKKKGLTQRDLSEKSGLSLRTIQRIENYENKPFVYSLRKIGEVLNHKFNLKQFNIMRNIFEKENRNYLTLILGLLSVSIGGCFYYSNQLDKYVDVVDMKMESDEIEDFLTFEWESMKEVVNLDTDKEILVKLIYSNKNSISSGINNFVLNYKLTISNFEEDIKTIENHLQNLNSIRFE